MVISGVEEETWGREKYISYILEVSIKTFRNLIIIGFYRWNFISFDKKKGKIIFLRD
jgi:hypothetical protein